jgi:tetratricopeptide (TPR) repeat protein/DNA-binding CsgD family transcriptional regulator
VEGEPGIGKTRLLLAAAEVARGKGFTTIAVPSDEEIRGPFLVARSILGSSEATSAASETPALEAVERGVAALEGRDEPGLESLPADRKLLRTLDLAAVALRALAAERPLALLIDDLQWADDDSLRLLRYLVRAAAGSRLFLMLSIRPEELAFVNEAVNLLADMERQGAIRRLKLARFGQVETGELLRQVLGGKVDPASAATMHAQAEGVPFIVEELVRAYRDAAMIQEIDGTWTLAKNADRLVPSSVRTLISRRGARLPEETRTALAEAAILGRNFSLKDLQALKLHLGEREVTAELLDETLAPAVAAGFLVAHSEDSPADYGFAHEQVRDFATAGLTPTRRRAVHAAVVELLLVGEPAPQTLPLLAYHAKAAGDAAVCVRFAIQASRGALDASAPEEVIRVVDLALTAAASSKDRMTLLQARDEALDMLRRANERLQGLAEMTALAEAMGDTGVEMDVQLRRAAAFRQAEEWEQAAQLAARVQDRAAERGDTRTELAACLELGQALLQTALGESVSPPEREVDADGAEKAYARAEDLAEQLADESSLAAVNRERGVILLARVRSWFVERVKAGDHIPLMQRVAAGESLDEILQSLPVAPLYQQVQQRFERALRLYEKVGDRRGAMSSIIAMAYSNWAPDIHLGVGAGRHIEELHRLASRMDSFTKESERFAAQAQMLYGAHVFARAKIVPDLALSRGQETYRQARVMGDRALEFMAAGGTALAHLDLGEVEEAKPWLDRAAVSAAESPTPFRARQLETWRGMWSGAAGHGAEMLAHLDRAVQLATEQGRPAARCEVLALLALESARLGAAGGDVHLLDTAERAATEAKELNGLLPGHPPWGAQADAALARVALARGERDEAESAARSAMNAFESALTEDAHLEILLPAAEALQGTDDQTKLRTLLQITLAMTAQRTLDEDVRVRWLRGPTGRKLVELSGPLEGLAMRPPEDGGPPPVDESDTELLRLLLEGLSNEEIGRRLAIEVPEVMSRLGAMFARVGASSQAEATAFAFRERVV